MVRDSHHSVPTTMLMSRRTELRCCLPLALIALLAAAAPAAAWAQETPPVKLDPSIMSKRGTVDPRYLSFNIEMVEVTGGRFWKPYRSMPTPPPPQPGAHQPAALGANLYEYRPPLDLSSPRLRKLAAALGPSYLRVSGTWANSAWFQNNDQPAATQPPSGFRSVLTRSEWKGVLDFSRAIDAPVVSSVAVSSGTRDAQGVWTPAQAKALYDYTKSIGGHIAATEFMNEPTFASMGGAPASYTAADYGRDAKLFAAFLHEESPGTLYLGPGSIGEGISLLPAGISLHMLSSKDLLEASGPVFDVFSYHFYGSVSRRCGGHVTVDQALSADWLDRTDTVEAFYAGLRDRFLPGKPIWLTETAEAACGGDPMAAQFVDTFRFLNQLGTLAQRGVQVAMHNTLSASDYGLLDEQTLDPRPDYWAALLWKRLMGSTVLDPGPDPSSDPGSDAGAAGDSLRLYAQCLPGHKGGVTLLALNTDPHSARTVSIPVAADRTTLTAPDLTSTTIQLNGAPLHAHPDGSLPALHAEHVHAGDVTLAPLSVTFLAIPQAHNPACR
ncbi:MAG: hypothetical protein WBW84_18690 [Acidobacteriaceae bacterium]